MRPRKLSPRIIALWRAGTPRREIAKTGGCNESNVDQVLRHHLGAAYRVGALGRDVDLWIRQQAGKTKVKPTEFVRALLIDAINEAMEKSE